MPHVTLVLADIAPPPEFFAFGGALLLLAIAAIAGIVIAFRKRNKKR